MLLIKSLFMLWSVKFKSWILGGSYWLQRATPKEPQKVLLLLTHCCKTLIQSSVWSQKWPKKLFKRLKHMTKGEQRRCVRLLEVECIFFIGVWSSYNAHSFTNRPFVSSLWTFRCGPFGVTMHRRTTGYVYTTVYHQSRYRYGDELGTTAVQPFLVQFTKPRKFKSLSNDTFGLKIGWKWYHGATVPVLTYRSLATSSLISKW